jgi:tyrosyl-DNA phosphodiesterase-1
MNNSAADKIVQLDLTSMNQFKEAYRLNKIKYSQEKDNVSISQLMDLVDDAEVAVLTTYKIRMDWLLDQCPSLLTIPEVVIAHGDIVLDTLPDNFQLIKPYVPQYGCPHGKIMVLFGKTHLLVMISTGNLIEVDYERKTNGIWYQVFPLRNNNLGNETTMGIDFKLALYDYILQLGISKAICNRLNKYNFDDVLVRLITSVPGTHSGANLDKYGHMKLRKELAAHVPQFSDQQIYCQLSSIGSVDDKWIKEFSQSCTGGTKAPKLNVIWPSVDFVKNCVDGMDAGGALCLPGKNLKPAVQNLFQRYQPRQKGRATIPPHIKTFLKFKKNDELEWLCLTSANFSKAAWGVLQKNGAQLTMNNFEIGVLFLPSILKKSIFVGEELNISADKITLPIPYAIPAPVYNLGEKPWTWDEFPK